MDTISSVASMQLRRIFGLAENEWIVWYDIPGDKVFQVLSSSSADILRVKPSTININGFEVPQPVRQELEPGQTYYYISFEFDNGKAYSKDIWTDYSNDKQRLLAGIIHLTEGAAMQHSNALLSFTQKPKS